MDNWGSRSWFNYGTVSRVIAVVLSLEQSYSSWRCRLLDNLLMLREDYEEAQEGAESLFSFFPFSFFRFPSWKNRDRGQVLDVGDMSHNSYVWYHLIRYRRLRCFSERWGVVFAHGYAWWKPKSAKCPVRWDVWTTIRSHTLLFRTEPCGVS